MAVKCAEKVPHPQPQGRLLGLSAEAHMRARLLCAQRESCVLEVTGPARGPEPGQSPSALPWLCGCPCGGIVSEPYLSRLLSEGNAHP